MKAYNIVITVSDDDADKAYDQYHAIVDALQDLEEEGVLGFPFNTQVHETVVEAVSEGV